jgi:hypothetical protein
MLREWAHPNTSPNAHELASDIQIAPKNPALKRPIAIMVPSQGFVVMMILAA